MWNEMVKDEEITFSGEESAHPGMELRDDSIYLTLCVFFFYRYTVPPPVNDGVIHFCDPGAGSEFQPFECKTRLTSEFLLLILEDCTDCFGSQKKDEPNDKEKKEEEETSASVHHSIIETWDWGRQPGERST